MRLTLGLILAFAASGAFAQPFAHPQEAVERMMAASAAQDAEAMAALYAEDALLLVPGQPAVEGRSEIRAAWADAFADGFGDLIIGTPRNRRGAEAAASVYLWAAQVSAADGQRTTLRGRTLLFLQQVGDGWLISAEMWQPVPDPD